MPDYSDDDSRQEVFDVAMSHAKGMFSVIPESRQDEIERALRNQLLVNTHDPLDPVGFHRFMTETEVRDDALGLFAAAILASERKPRGCYFDIRGAVETATAM